ncbi:hypothetical protein [Mycobacterium vicinigordonae]|uniref:Uncharacterized protein n=1 Tax=Mycobacterium vicinigordonae TaxID=1719132 RepID=A0A7D6HRV8_9MYCO|nr:hypothetical protein [Mycobacterium vicinigordonae]QLL08451.1 hypothetical protein H0P51_05790 [Mycobacterium vicinigordonae]
MAPHEGGRWDVGTKDDEVYLGRMSEDDERLFEDLLSPDAARELAGLLTKYADRADDFEPSDEKKDDHSDDSDEDGDDEDDGDDDEDGDEDNYTKDRDKKEKDKSD